MPCVNIPINPVGPVFDVGVSRPSFQLPQGQKPPIHWFKALADTGCSHTAIHSSVATKCGLGVIGKIGVSTPGGNRAVNQYYGDIHVRSVIAWTLPFDYVFNDRALNEMYNQNPNFDVLLGMDILNLGLFVVHGGLKAATFCW